MSSTILTFGHDPTLLKTREMVLRQDGFQVLSANECSEITHVLNEQRVDLLILCHTVWEHERKYILSLAHTSDHGPKTLVLLSPISSVVPSDSDTAVCSLDGPRSLLAIVHKLIGRPAPSLHALAS